MTSVMVDGDGDRIAAESWEKNRKSRLRPPLTERTLQEKLYCQVCIIARYKPLSKCESFLCAKAQLMILLHNRA
jgi:hypothetical protein